MIVQVQVFNCITVCFTYYWNNLFCYLIMAASTSGTKSLNHFRKRSLSGSDTEEPDYKTSRTCSYYYVLEPSSESSSGLEDTESVYSVQGKPTDSAKDTSDLSYSEEDSNVVYTIAGGEVITTRITREYEPASLSEKENSIPDILTSASDGDNFVETFGCEVIVSVHDEDTWADSSSVTSEGEPPIDPELSLRDYWSCVQCKATNNNPLFRYCEKCFKIRKNFFPPRPKLNKKKNKKKKQRIRMNRKKDRKNSGNKLMDSNDSSQNQLQGDCSDKNACLLSNCQNSLNSDSIATDNSLFNCKSSSTGSSFTQSSSISSSSSGTVIVDDQTNEFLLSKSSELSILNKCLSHDEPDSDSRNCAKESSLCETCLTRPKDGVFVHGRKLGHMFCCYQCSKKVWKATGRCPLCNCKISQVLKVIS